jgi:hypothetical protein
MNETDLRSQFQYATATEPPLSLNVDSVVRGGKLRLRHRRAAVSAGLAAGAALVVAVPLTVAGAPGGGGSIRAGGSGVTTPSIEPTPGDEHGGCRTQTHSASTSGMVFGQWLLGRLPQGFFSDPGWQNNYQTDCVDGAKLDEVDGGARMRGHDGDINVNLIRSVPASQVTPPCQPEKGVLATKLPTPTSGLAPNTQPTIAEHFDYCKTDRRQDGTTVTIEEKRMPEMGPDYRARTVTWWRTDGTRVVVELDNRHVLNDSQPSPQLRLTRQQQLDLATNPDILVYLPAPR